MTELNCNEYPIEDIYEEDEEKNSEVRNFFIKNSDKLIEENLHLHSIFCHLFLPPMIALMLNLLIFTY